MLHPSPEEEKRRHKKKRLVQSPNSYFMDVKCPGMFFFLQLALGDMGLRRVHSSTLKGRCQCYSCFFCPFFRLLQNHNSVQPCSDSCALCWLFNGPVSAHWRQSTSHRGSVFQYKIYFIAYLNPMIFSYRCCLKISVLVVDFFFFFFTKNAFKIGIYYYTSHLNCR